LESLVRNIIGLSDVKNGVLVRLRPNIQIDRLTAITGIYASVRPYASNAFEQTGRIVEVAVTGATRLWLRVTMRDHSSCLFNSNLPGVEMEGSYLCFHNATSAERGRWKVWRSY
jgi:hypothetical protein